METATPKATFKPYPLGWKAKIGILIPSVDTGYCSYEFRKVCPDGVVTLETRVGMGRLTLENLQKMKGDVLHGSRLLATANPDVITYEATAAGFVLGVEGEQTLIREIEDETGIKATTGASSVAESLKFLGTDSVSIFAATSEDITAFAAKYLSDSGFDVREVESASFGHATEGFRWSPWEVYSNVMKFYRRCPDVDAVFIAGGCFRTLEMIETLEKDIGRPVVTTVPANMWHCLKIAGVKDPVYGFGQLLEKPR